MKKNNKKNKKETATKKKEFCLCFDALIIHKIWKNCLQNFMSHYFLL